MTSLQQEYLQLVQQTHLLLLQQKPRSKKGNVRIAAPPPIEKVKIENIPPPIPVPKPTPKKEIALPLPPKEEKHDLKDILDLIKTHCPNLKLIEPTDILLMTEGDPVEAALMQNLCNALLKQGIHAAIVNPTNVLEKSAKIVIATKALIVKSTALHPFAKRDAQNRLMLSNAMLAILPLEHERRLEFWNYLLDLWKTL